MFALNQEELQNILGQLDHAMHNHQNWFEGITRTLVCRLPHDRRDVREDAHRECQFGQWYYQDASEALRQHPAFVAIEQEHALMHRLAGQLLVVAANDQPITPVAYDSYANSVQRLRLQIMTMQRELQDSMFNLDPLTGANSRVGMLTRLRELHELVKRNAQLCSLAMMDLDLFKLINDTHGHRAGDMVLKNIVRYLLENIRPYDTLFRYGGEEFLLCMQQTDPRAALALVERLREGIEALDITVEDEQVVRLTVSFGVAPLDADVFVEESVHRADQALYRAKKEGRNRSVLWQPFFVGDL